MNRLRVSLTLLAVGLALALPAVAQAARKATRPERRALAAVVLPRGNPYYRGGQLGWAEVSTAGRYAVAWVAARPHNTSFQSALVLLAGRGRHWRYVADILHEGCPGVPRRVLLDFRHFFATKKPKFLTPGVPGYYGCAAKIAYAK